MRHAHYSTRCRLLPWTLCLQFIGLITRVRIVPAEMRGGYSLENVAEDLRPFRGDAQFGRFQSEADIQRAALTVRIMSARPSHVELRIKSLPSVTLLLVLAHAPMACRRSDFILFICSAGDAGLFSPSARRLVRQGSHVILKFAGAAASTTKRHEPRSAVAPAHSDSETHKRLCPDPHRITLAEGDASRRIGQWAQRLPRWLTGKREQALVNQADPLDIAAKPGQEGPQSRKKRTPSRSSPSAKGGTLASSSDAEASADAVDVDQASREARHTSSGEPSYDLTDDK